MIVRGGGGDAIDWAQIAYGAGAVTDFQRYGFDNQKSSEPTSRGLGREEPHARCRLHGAQASPCNHVRGGQTILRWRNPRRSKNSAQPASVSD